MLSRLTMLKREMLNFRKLIIVFFISLFPINVHANKYVSKAIKPLVQGAFLPVDKSLRKTVVEYAEKKIAVPLSGIMAIGYGSGLGVIYPPIMKDELSVTRASGFFELLGLEAAPAWSKPVVYDDLAKELVDGTFALLTRVEKLRMSSKNYEDYLLEAYLLVLKMTGGMPYYIRSQAQNNLEMGLQDNFFEIIKLTVITINRLNEGIGKYFAVDTELKLASSTHRISMISTTAYYDEMYKVISGIENLFIHVTSRLLTSEHHGIYIREASGIAAIIRKLAEDYGIDNPAGTLYRKKGHVAHEVWRRKF